jgi:arylsulfatase A
MINLLQRREFLALLGAGMSATFCKTLFADPAGKPNFVVVLGEGHGWSSTSVQMDDAVPESRSTFIRTPNFEKLAAGGMRFADFYAPSPRCTPTRASLLTGKNPAQLHMTFVNEGKRENSAEANNRVIPPASSTELPTNEITIAQLLKNTGYATAHFGKWHMGRANPNRHGFDESDGATDNGGPDDVENPHPKQLYGMTERGMDFMARQAKAFKPFYLQLSHYASRNGGDARPESIATVKSWGGNINERELGTAAADVDLDIAFGMVLKKLDELGIAGNTYVSSQQTMERPAGILLLPAARERSPKEAFACRSSSAGQESSPAHVRM